MKRFTLSVIVVLMMANFSFAQNELYIINPEWGGWWGGDPGNIEEATFLIEPKGVYTEVQMFLTFGYPWGNVGNDSLEIVMDFTLPEGAIVHDSWLWIYDLPVQADILDIWTATAIYEDIVDRQTDPSLLFEQDNGYQLRVYPLTAEEKRKVKITMLLPTKWSSASVATELPTHILNLSHDEIPICRILVKADDSWENLQFDNPENLSFESIDDPEFGTVLETNIDGQNVENQATISFDAPLTEGLYINTYEGEEENFYQMVLNPTEYGVEEPNKKLVFCFDHSDGNSNFPNAVSETTLFNALKAAAASELTENDSFNIVYSHENGSHVIFNQWQPFTASAMGTLPLFFDHSDIEQSMLASLDFIQNSGGEGDIILISNSTDLQTPVQANPVLDVLNGANTTDVTIHVLDFENWGSYTWISNLTSYYGNQYFNNLLTQSTGGNNYILRANSNHYSNFSNYFSTGTSTILQSAKKVYGDYDLYTSLSEGVCHSRYDASEIYDVPSLHHPVVQLGKFVGEFPFEIEYTTIIDNDFNVQEILVDSPDLITGDTLNEEMWTWHRIQEMEAGNPDNNTVQDIIDLSTKTRVLSQFTAFLAVEPEILPDEPCFGCWDDDDQTVDTEEVIQDDAVFEITAFPNPFSDKVLINLTIQSDTDIKNMDLAIYDQLGRKVARPTIFQRLSGTKLQLTWDGKDGSGNDLASGTYFLVVTSDKGTGNYKLLKI